MTVGPTANTGQSAGSSLRVLAAGSLRTPFGALAVEWRRRSELAVAVTYANARDLAHLIENGEPADVFASASPEHPAALHAGGLLEAPRRFATNHLVIAVPADSQAADARILAAPECRVVIEVAGIPLGDYTRVLLERLDENFGAGYATAALANVVSEEQTVSAVIERLNGGGGDAAVLYSTDVASSAGRLRAIEVPAEVRGIYVIATVRGTRQPEAARAWLALTTGRFGQRVLREAGFSATP